MVPCADDGYARAPGHCAGTGDALSTENRGSAMSRNTLHLCCLLLVLAMRSASGDGALPRNFEASYALHTGGVNVGTLQRRLSIDDTGAYRFESLASTAGVVALFKDTRITETSIGQVRDGRIHPARYHYQRQSGKRRKEITIEFAPDGEAVVNRNGALHRYTAAAGTLDKLSYQLALMADLAAGVAQYRYSVADDDRLKEYALQQNGTESIRVDGRAVSAVKFVYQKPGSRRRTELWCAADYQFLPIRIAYREDDGATTVAHLTEFRATPGTP